MLIYGINVDESLGLPLFFLVGLYIALSPCLFPILPLTIFRVMNKEIVEETGEKIHPARKMALKWVIILCSGVIITFVFAAIILLYIWSYFGLFLIQLYRPLTYSLGIILIVMGIFLLFPKLSEKTFARIPIPQRVIKVMQREDYRDLDLFIIGFGYSFIALPCAFPVFFVLMSMILSTNNMVYTTFGMGLFSVGLFVPYLILLLVTAEARTRAASLLAEKFRTIEILVGILVIIFGLLFLWPAFGGPTLFALG